MRTLEMRQVSRVYGEGAAQVHALREVSLKEQTSGQVLIAGQDLAAMSRNEKARLRRQSRWSVTGGCCWPTSHQARWTQ
jgi:ABC-type methionine transport system ATPase subunit